MRVFSSGACDAGAKQLSHTLPRGARWIRTHWRCEQARKFATNSTRRSDASKTNRRKRNPRGDSGGSSNSFEVDSSVGGADEDKNDEPYSAASFSSGGGRLAALYDKYAAGGDPDAATVAEVMRAKQLAAARRARAAALYDAAAEASQRGQGVRDYLASRGLGAITHFRDVVEAEAERTLAELEEADLAALEAQVAAQGGDLETDWAAVETSRSTTGRAKAAASKRPGPRGEPLPDDTLLARPSNPQVERLRTHMKQMRRKRRLFDSRDDEVDGSLYDDVYSSGSDDDFSLAPRLPTIGASGVGLQRPSANPAGSPGRLMTPTPDPFRTLQRRHEEEAAEGDMDELLDNLYEHPNGPLYGAGLRGGDEGDDDNGQPALAAKPVRPGRGAAAAAGASRPATAAKPQAPPPPAQRTELSPPTGMSADPFTAQYQADKDYDTLMELLELVSDDQGGQDTRRGLGLGLGEDVEDAGVGAQVDADAAGPTGSTMSSKRPLTTTALMRGDQPAASAAAPKPQLLGKPGAVVGAYGGSGFAAMAAPSGARPSDYNKGSGGRASGMMDDDARFLEELLSDASFLSESTSTSQGAGGTGGASSGVSMQHQTPFDPLREDDYDLDLLSSATEAPSSRPPSLEPKPVTRSRSIGTTSTTGTAAKAAVRKGNSSSTAFPGASAVASGRGGASSVKRMSPILSAQAQQDQEELLRDWDLDLGDQMGEALLSNGDDATGFPLPQADTRQQLIAKPIKQAAAAPGARGPTPPGSTAAFSVRDLNIVMDGMLGEDDLQQEDGDGEFLYDAVPSPAPVVPLARPSRRGREEAGQNQAAAAGQGLAQVPATRPAVPPALDPITDPARTSGRVKAVSDMRKDDAAMGPKPAASPTPPPPRSVPSAVVASPAAPTAVPPSVLGASMAAPSTAVTSLDGAAAVLSDPFKASVLQKLGDDKVKLAGAPPRRRGKAEPAAVAAAAQEAPSAPPAKVSKPPREHSTVKGAKDTPVVSEAKASGARSPRTTHESSSSAAVARKGAIASVPTAGVQPQPLSGPTGFALDDFLTATPGDLSLDDRDSRLGDTTPDLSEGVWEMLREWNARESAGLLTDVTAKDATSQAALARPPGRTQPASVSASRSSTASSRGDRGPLSAPPGASKGSRAAAPAHGRRAGRAGDGVTGQPRAVPPAPAPESASTGASASVQARTGPRAAAVRAWRPGRAFVPGFASAASNGIAGADGTTTFNVAESSGGKGLGGNGEDTREEGDEAADSSVATGPAARPLIMALSIWSGEAGDVCMEAELPTAPQGPRPQQTARRGGSTSSAAPISPVARMDLPAPARTPVDTWGAKLFGSGTSRACGPRRNGGETMAAPAMETRIAAAVAVSTSAAGAAGLGHASAGGEGSTNGSFWSSPGRATDSPASTTAVSPDASVTSSSSTPSTSTVSKGSLRHLRLMVTRGEFVFGYILGFDSTTCTALATFPMLARLGVEQPIALSAEQLQGWRDWAAVAAMRPDEAAVATTPPSAARASNMTSEDPDADAEAAPLEALAGTSVSVPGKVMRRPIRTIWAAITAICATQSGNGGGTSTQQPEGAIRAEMVEVTRPLPVWCRVERTGEPAGPRKAVSLYRNREVVAHVVSISERGAYCELEFAGIGPDKAATTGASGGGAVEAGAGLWGAGAGASASSNTPDGAGRGGGAARPGGRELQRRLLGFLSIEGMAPALAEVWPATVKLDQAERRRHVAAVAASGAHGDDRPSEQSQTCAAAPLVMRVGDVVEAKIVDGSHLIFPEGTLLLVQLIQVPYRRKLDSLTL